MIATTPAGYVYQPTLHTHRIQWNMVFVCLKSCSFRLQESWKDIQQARERGNEWATHLLLTTKQKNNSYSNFALCLVLCPSRLEISLAQSEKQVCELSQSLAQSEEQLGQLETLSQSQSAEIQRLQDLCTQLSTVREMNEVSWLYTEHLDLLHGRFLYEVIASCLEKKG